VFACAGCSHLSLSSPDAADAQMPAGDAPDAPADVPDASVDAPYGTGMVGVEGAISPVHDPAIFATATKFYVYTTGRGLPIHESTDLVHWTLTGAVFGTKPPWITTTNPSDPNSLWAPDLSYFGGKYHLYYAASSFGSNQSCIGHATSPSLDAPVWEDKGAVICSTSSDNWNALDPAAVIDEQGGAWLAFGSFWSGLKLVALDSEGASIGTPMSSLATRSNTAIEAAYIIHHGDYYYLFESVDFCCRGVDSTYKIMVGRAAAITGPYVDQNGIPLLSGGGTLVLAGDSRWKGPGHNAILHTPAGDYNVYHSYDADSNGVPTLRIAEMRWSTDGWPISAGP
jgi:arabinan endo-1,5-alpha-L-arabinosidase